MRTTGAAVQPGIKAVAAAGSFRGRLNLAHIKWLAAASFLCDPLFWGCRCAPAP
jgi:hypothetical protein